MFLCCAGDSKTEGLVQAAGVLGKASALSVHNAGAGDAVRVKASFARTVCMHDDMSTAGLFGALLLCTFASSSKLHKTGHR